MQIAVSRPGELIRLGSLKPGFVVAPEDSAWNCFDTITHQGGTEGWICSGRHAFGRNLESYPTIRLVRSKPQPSRGRERPGHPPLIGIKIVA